MKLEAPAFMCPEPECGRRFSRKYTMLEHLKTHTGEKPHLCPVRTCGKRFSTSGNLSRHKRLHATIDPLPCPVQGCLSAFESANKLEKHMKFHRGDAVHVCTVNNCGKTFSTTGNLNRHIKQQHPDAMDIDVHSSPTKLVGTQVSFKSIDNGSPSSMTPQPIPIEDCDGDFRHSGDMLDMLTDILHEHTVVKPGDEPMKVSSLLDEVISFHVTHMSTTQ